MKYTYRENFQVYGIEKGGTFEVATVIYKIVKYMYLSMYCPTTIGGVGEGQGKLILEVFFYNQESIIMDSWYDRVSRYIVAHYVYWNNSLFSNSSLRHCFSYKGRHVHS